MIQSWEGAERDFLLEAVKVVAMRPSAANTGTVASATLINHTSCIIPFLSAFFFPNTAFMVV